MTLSPISPFAPLARAFTDWAAADPSIRALIVVGSQARPDAGVPLGTAEAGVPLGTADRWSDLDLCAYCLQPHKYLRDTGWLHAAGTLELQAIDHTPRGDPEWFLLFAGGLKIDILLIDIANLSGDRLSDWVRHPDFIEVTSRGVAVLVDKTATPPAQDAQTPPSPVMPPMPAQSDLSDLAQRFALAAVRAARLLQRGDLWRTLHFADHEIKGYLLALIEWHARSINGPEYDTWYDGRRLSEWAAPHALERLHACFAGYDRLALQAALLAACRLFADLGQETAANLGLSFPEAVQRVLSNPLQDPGEVSSTNLPRK